MNGKVIIFLLIIGTSIANGASENQSRTVTPVLENWKFIRADANEAQTITFDDSKWTDVTLPHTWNDKDTMKGSNYYRGTAWYRTKLTIPTTAKDKRVFIRFEAASLVADVYFNGVHLGQHRGGFTAFCYEFTKEIKWDGDNVLAVKVNNSNFQDVPPLGGDFNIYGGLYRPVWLIITNKVCISPLDYGSDGVYFKQTSVNKDEAIIDVTANVSNGFNKTVSAALIANYREPNGFFQPVRKLLNMIEIRAGETVVLNDKFQISRPHLWNGRIDPFMYEAKVDLIFDYNTIDVIYEPIGLRYYSVDPNKGFFLNGESYPLRGVNRHQDRVGKGWAISEADQDEDANIIEELGATCVRCAHYPHSDYFYSLCDKKGFVVWAELPQVNQILNTPAFAENAKQQLTELIRQRYNHPSICFWSLYNELGNSGKCDDPRPLLTELQKLAKEEDPTRLTTAASNDPIKRWPGANQIADLIAWNPYYGWYTGTAPQLNQILDKYKHDANDKPVGVSEYGAGASIKQHELNIKKQPIAGSKWHPEEYQAIVHEENYQAIEKRPFIWGSFLWVMFDFASAGRNEGDTPGINDKGLVTADRKTRKDAFYFYKAKWSKEPFVYITSRRFTERKDPNAPTKIYSNCESVELKVNDKSMGKQERSNCIFKWPDVVLKEGQNTIEAIATHDGKSYIDKCEWILKSPEEPNGNPK